MTLTESYVRSAFDKLATGDIPGFLDLIHDDVDWPIINPEIGSCPISGRFGKTTFPAAKLSFIACLAAPLEWTVNDVIVSSNKVVIQADGRGESKHGKAKAFFSPHCWIFDFDDTPEHKIVKALVFMDSALVRDVMASNAA